MNEKIIMWSSIFITFLAMSLLASPAHSQFRSTLLSCPNAINDLCGNFYVVTATPEPLTDGFARVFPTGILRVKVVGAFPNATYEVVMTSSAGGLFHVVGFLSTDAFFGDGVVNIPLPPDTYVSGVVLMRNSDGSPPCAFPCSPTGTGTDPRIFTGFVIP